MKQTVLRCTRVEADTRMFTSGRLYEARPNHNGRLWIVYDDLGHQRFISVDDLRFIVKNDFGPVSPLSDAVSYAHFEKADL